LNAIFQIKLQTTNFLVLQFRFFRVILFTSVKDLINEDDSYQPIILTSVLLGICCSAPENVVRNLVWSFPSATQWSPPVADVIRWENRGRSDRQEPHSYESRALNRDIGPGLVKHTEWLDW